MTTLVAIHQPLELLSMSDQPVRRSKRQPPGALAREAEEAAAAAAAGRETLTAKTAADYEHDDDFHFVRKSKKPKTEEPPEPLPIRKSTRGRPPAAAAAAAAATARDRASKEATDAAVNASTSSAKGAVGGREAATTTTKTSTTTATTTTTTKTKATGTRKSARSKASSIDASKDEPQLKVVKRATRRSVRLSGEVVPMEEDPPQQQANGPSRRNAPSNKEKPPSPKPAERPAPVMQSPVHETSVESAKIALPMSDTPIINRNKEMRRKGGNSNRRSSLGSRGRRASSLIESGQAAIPHREVNPSEFYKHIEAEGLPEPRRMKQLLIWCGERALSEKPRHGTLNSGAILGARAIQDQLLKDFASRSEFSDWFNRDDDVPKAPVILKPNPRNIELDEKLATLQAKIKRLQEEKKAWLSIRKPPPEQPPLFSPQEADRIILPDFDLLDPEEGKIRGYLADETNSFASIRSQTESRLQRIQSSLEFEVDQLADNVHKLEQRVAVAGREADRVLSLSAQRLREREEREKDRARTREMPIMEVLRSLSSILPEGGG